MYRFLLSIILLCSASSITAKVDQDTMPFLVMPDGQKVMATHVLKFPLKREASGLAYDPLTKQFITCFDKGIPQLATFRLTDSIEDLRQLSIAGDTTYYDLEGVEVQRSDSFGIRLKLCGERVLHDSLPILTLRFNSDSCWHDSALVLTRPYELGVNTNAEGIAVQGSRIYLVKERESPKILSLSGPVAYYGYPFGDDSSQGKMIDIARTLPAFSHADDKRVIAAATRSAYSALCIDTQTYDLLVVNRPARTIEIYQATGPISIITQARYELVDHPLEWTGTDTGDLLYGLVEGIAIGQVNGIRSLVMITDPGFGNYPKVVVFQWVYSNPAALKSTK